MNKEFRVYILSADNFDTNGYEIENWKAFEQETNRLDDKTLEFISVCKEEGVVYSLNGFQNALNRKEINITNKLVYITNKY